MKRLFPPLLLTLALQALSAAIRTLGLSVTWNDGIAFSAFRASFPVVTAGVAGLVVVTRLCLRRPGRLTAPGLTLLWGGAASNAADRIIHGAVMDYLPLPLPEALPLLPAMLHLNGADVAVIVGAALVLAKGSGRPKSGVRPTHLTR